MRNKPSFLIALFLLSKFTGCAQNEPQTGAHGSTYTNALINETSPYLLQHAHNPVDWFPWGDEALRKAKDENKLMVISIGYSACHWCHVMERESYEDTAVAAIMNRSYVSIKIDREERPDIDQVYIEAAQMMNGRAGWPLNVIALPDGTPVFTGTYFPKDEWMRILRGVQEIYARNPEKLMDQAQRVKANLDIMNQVAPSKSNFPDEEEMQRILEIWSAKIDPRFGGLQSTQKFPLPGGFLQLLDPDFFKREEHLKKKLELTLDRIALGGIFDHVGGGFHRYTVETAWRIPHFEKMLYDNAQLISLYSEAYKVFGNELYRRAATQTIDFALSNMMSEKGGFYSSFDADSEDEEGTFYIWSQLEITEALGDDRKFLNYFSITEKGNWEDGKNVLYIDPRTFKEFSDQKSPLDRIDRFDSQLKTLKDIRQGRIKPALDDKVLTAWNALMIQGLVDAYFAFGDQNYLSAATRTAAFLAENQMMDDGRLNRSYKDGTSSINGFLNDYAFLIQAFTDLYQATFEIEWLQRAGLLSEYCIEHFWDESVNLFRFTSDLDEKLLIQKFETTDNVIPSGNSVMAYNLMVLGNLYYEQKPEYLEMSDSMARSVVPEFLEYPFYYYGWLPVFRQKVDGLYEIAIVGPNHASLLAEIRSKPISNAIFLGGSSDTDLTLLENKLVPGETYIYVCREKYCKLPVKSVAEALGQMDP